MSSILSHPPARIAHSKRPVSTRSSLSAVRGWSTRAGDWLVGVGERATHHRLGSWTRR